MFLFQTTITKDDSKAVSSYISKHSSEHQTSTYKGYYVKTNGEWATLFSSKGEVSHYKKGSLWDDAGNTCSPEHLTLMASVFKHDKQKTETKGVIPEDILNRTSDVARGNWTTATDGTYRYFVAKDPGSEEMKLIIKMSIDKTEEFYEKLLDRTGKEHLNEVTLDELKLFIAGKIKKKETDFIGKKETADVQKLSEITKKDQSLKELVGEIQPLIKTGSENYRTKTVSINDHKYYVETSGGFATFFVDGQNAGTWVKSNGHYQISVRDAQAMLACLQKGVTKISGEKTEFIGKKEMTDDEKLKATIEKITPLIKTGSENYRTKTVSINDHKYYVETSGGYASLFEDGEKTALYVKSDGQTVGSSAMTHAHIMLACLQKGVTKISGEMKEGEKKEEEKPKVDKGKVTTIEDAISKVKKNGWVEKKLYSSDGAYYVLCDGEKWATLIFTDDDKKLIAWQKGGEPAIRGVSSAQDILDIISSPKFTLPTGHASYKELADLVAAKIGNGDKYSKDKKYKVEMDGTYATLFEKKDGKYVSTEGYIKNDGFTNLYVSNLIIMADVLGVAKGKTTKESVSEKTGERKSGIKYRKISREEGYNPNVLTESLKGDDYLKQFDQVFLFTYGKFDKNDPTRDVSVKGYTASKVDAEKKFKEAAGIMESLGWSISSMDADKAKVFLETVRKLAQGKSAEDIISSYKEVSLKDAAAKVTGGISNYVEAFGGSLSSMTLAPISKDKNEEGKNVSEEKMTVPVWEIIKGDDFLKVVWGILTPEEKGRVEKHFGKDDENLSETQSANRMELADDKMNVLLEATIGKVTGYFYPLNSDSIRAEPRVAERLDGYDKKEHPQLIEKGKVMKENGVVVFSVNEFLKQVPEKKEEKEAGKEAAYSNLGRLMIENKSLMEDYYLGNSLDGSKRNINELDGVKAALQSEFSGKQFTARQVIDFITEFDGGVTKKKEETAVKKEEPKKEENVVPNEKKQKEPEMKKYDPEKKQKEPDVKKEVEEVEITDAENPRDVKKDNSSKEGIFKNVNPKLTAGMDWLVKLGEDEKVRSVDLGDDQDLKLEYFMAYAKANPSIYSESNTTADGVATEFKNLKTADKKKLDKALKKLKKQLNISD